jgi:hypothetical protein
MMKRIELSRREFHRLTVAAFGGVVAGAAIGCGDNGDDAGSGGGRDDETTTGDATQTDATISADNSQGNGEQELVGGERPELNACLGLNQCKQYGKNPGEHDCAGYGACATAKSHDCATKNECKYLGGCAGKSGTNECRGQGGCQMPLVPFGDESWQQARTAFEKRMKEAGVKVGAAPLPEETDSGS